MSVTCMLTVSQLLSDWCVLPIEIVRKEEGTLQVRLRLDGHTFFTHVSREDAVSCERDTHTFTIELLHLPLKPLQP